MKRLAVLVLALALLASLLPTLSVTAKAADTLDLTLTDGVLSWQALDGADHYLLSFGRRTVDSIHLSGSVNILSPRQATICRQPWMQIV